MSRELTYKENEAARALCLVRHPLLPMICSECRADIVSLVDGPPSGGVPEVAAGMEAMRRASVDAPHAAQGSFPDGSYEIPLETRLEAAAQDGPSIPRLGIVPTDKHSVPLTSAEGRQLLTLLRATPPSGSVPEKNCLVPLARLGAWVLAEMRENASDIDGGDVQDKAEEFGVVSPEPAQKPCCENCLCAEFDADTCYRNTKATTDALSVLEAVSAWQGRTK